MNATEVIEALKEHYKAIIAQYEKDNKRLREAWDKVIEEIKDSYCTNQEAQSIDIDGYGASYFDNGLDFCLEIINKHLSEVEE